MFALLILIRILFVAAMVFVVGYVFGGFSKKPVLKTLSRIAAIVLIVLFLSMNFFIGRSWHGQAGWCSDFDRQPAPPSSTY